MGDRSSLPQTHVRKFRLWARKLSYFRGISGNTEGLGATVGVEGVFAGAKGKGEVQFAGIDAGVFVGGLRKDFRKLLCWMDLGVSKAC